MCSHKSMCFQNLLSLLHLLTRLTKGKEPLIDYSQSHFITSITYLNILREKIIDKVGIKETRQERRKEKEDEQKKKKL